MVRAGRRVKGIAAIALAALVVGCAGAPHDASLPIDDPNESFNRGVLKFNQFALDPAANVVKTVTPGPVLNRLRDLDTNLREPRVFANNVLQGRFNAAGITFARFVFNSTLGIGGLFDIATAGGLPQQTGDYGQTLFVWGVPAGTFVNSPYFGPSTQRDSVGGVVDTVANPVGLALGVFGWPASVATGALGAEVHLGQWQQAEDASIDFYTFLRSAYYQTRRAQLREALGLPPEVYSPATAAPGR